MSAVALKRNGVACHKIKKFSGVEKQNISSQGHVDNSPAPVVFLTFEENSGSTTEDYSESGTDHDADVVGTWSTVYKAAGNCSITYGSTSQWTENHDHADFDWPVGTSWTISSYLATVSTSYVGVYVKRETAGAGYTGPAIFMNNGKLEIYLIDTWGSESCHLVPTGTSTDIKEAGVYHHVVVTYDGSSNGGSGGFTGYVDGVKHTVANGKLAVGSGGDDLDSNSDVVNNTDIHWGADTATSGLQSGGTDQSAAWKGVHITDAQAAVLYNSGTPIDVRRGL